MSHAARLAKLRTLVDIPLLVSDPEDVFYYSGYRAGIDDHPLLFIPKSGKPSLLVSPLAPKVDAYAQPVFQKEFAALLPPRMGIDEHHLSWATVEDFKKRHELANVSELIKKPREIKDEGEIARMKKAIAIDATTIKNVSIFGKTEIEIAKDIELAFFKKDATPAYETIVASGGNAGSYIHHVPGKRKTSVKDSIIIDFGAKVDGYSSDITRTYINKKDKKQLHMFETIKQLQQECIDLVRPGTSFMEINEFHKNQLTRAGFDAKHGIGHGIGIFVHEPAKQLEKGMVITIEPGIYIPGSMGCRIEDMVLVGSKPIVLSKNVPLWPFG